MMFCDDFRPSEDGRKKREVGVWMGPRRSSPAIAHKGFIQYILKLK
jgi:hypothetical protein